MGVYSLEDGRHYWPRELQVQTDPRGPPFVEAPEFIQSDGPHTAQFRLSPARLMKYKELTNTPFLSFPVRSTVLSVITGS